MVPVRRRILWRARFTCSGQPDAIGAAVPLGGATLDSSPLSDARDWAAPGSHPTPPPTLTSPSSDPASGDTTVVMSPSSNRFSSGQILGNRYRIVSLLGRGGMGEVWQAYDLKLQVEVALKSILPGRFAGDGGREVLRNEVRSAREVISPNVCRIFDLVEQDGREFVSMEYIDGKTLLSLLRERAPLPIPEATRIAAQFLSGLEAIHQAGLVHRDVKPENIMITRTGRVLLMDFGIAKGLTEDQRGTIAGTPAYMAPEQSRGEAIDARADIFAAGVTLAEMIAPAGLHDHTTRKSIWDAVRHEPVHLFDSPWRRVLERAVAAQITERYASARELVRALEDVPQRIEGAEDKRPYPGLASFSEKDAEFFFGRELDVEAVWKKLQRSSLLALIGASGAGKTSFLHAGLIPAMPEGWRQIVIRPSSAPFAALGQALVPELAGDVEATRALVRLDDPKQALLAVGRWRAAHAQVLLICDQFEELFTLCRPEVQTGFADLLGRLAIQADVHVLLSMRDDFLLHCHGHPRLAPISSDLTMLGPPTGSTLRRALVQPSLLCGYRFEDEALADQMLDAVVGERGALPLVAFAASRLWENRDRERGLLTRAAYEGIGGVSGALAQHAEATLERIGPERESIVREIFRNLVTSHGTRAVTEVEELLSVFGDQAAAGEVLRELLAARLLTSFEIEVEGGQRHRRVEVVHESLLAQWPRLVRWQTQDADSAQFRDQLRQQAQLWNERGRAEDLLWAGNSYRDFVVWRERYPGALTATEEQYAQAMTVRAERLRRRRRRILTGSFATLAVVLAAMTLLWVRAQMAERRSEARRLLALGRLEMPSNPTGALAYATTSLEIQDSPEVRRFVMETLATGPPGFALDEKAKVPGGPWPHLVLDWSPDGRWIAVAQVDGTAKVWPQDGGDPVVLMNCGTVQFAQRRNTLVSLGDDGWQLRSLPEGRELPFPKYLKRFSGPEWRCRGFLKDDVLLVRVLQNGDRTRLRFGRWGYESGAVRESATIELSPAAAAYDPTGHRFSYHQDGKIYALALDSLDAAAPRVVGRFDGPISLRSSVIQPGGGLVASITKSPFTKADVGAEIWSIDKPSEKPLWSIAAGFDYSEPKFDATGRWFGAPALLPAESAIWDLNVEPGAKPLQCFLPRALLASGVKQGRGRSMNSVGFSPDGAFAAVVFGDNTVAVFPLDRPAPRKLYEHSMVCCAVQFSPDGRFLASGSNDGTLRTWTVDPNGSPASRLLCERVQDKLGLVGYGGGDRIYQLDISRDGKWIVGMCNWGSIVAVPSDGSGPVVLGGFRMFPTAAVMAPDRMQVAVVGVPQESRKPVVRLWELGSGAVRTLDPVAGGVTGKIQWLVFLPQGRLLVASTEGLFDWNLDDSRSRLLRSGAVRPQLLADQRHLVCAVEHPDRPESDRQEIGVLDLADESWHHVTSSTLEHSYVFSANGTHYAILDNTGGSAVVCAGDVDMMKWTLGEPHVLAVIADGIAALDIHPNGSLVAMGVMDGSVRIVEIPEGPPLQLLEHDKFIDHLHALTNVRAVQDENVSEGYRLVAERFPGWRPAKP